MKVSKQITNWSIAGLSTGLFILFSCNQNAANTPSTSKTTSPKKVDIKKADPVVANPDDIFKLDSFKSDTSKKYIYFTFDDGPQGGTNECVNVCKKASVKATFFMVGDHANSAHLKKEVSDIKYSYPLLLLANHSTSHANNKYHYFYAHEQMALQDFLKAQQTLQVPYKIIRLPGNTSWVREKKIRIYNKETQPVCKLLDSCGYNVIGWDLEWEFTRKNAHPKQSAESFINQVNTAFEKNHLMEKNHLVILTHDRMFKNNYTDSLAKVIDQLKLNKNYVFETIDHYPGLKKIK